LTTWTKVRSELATKSKILPPDHPKLTELRRNLRALRLEEHVAKVLAAWPPLSTEQLDRIAGLLKAGRD
jgi:hypothetical protein